MEQSLPTTMRTVIQNSPTSSQLTLTQTPLPTPSSPDHVLIKVIATAPCYSELTWLAQNPQFFPPDKELVPGQDVSGIVVCSSDQSAFRPGDHVFCRLDATRPGGLRDYTIALESELAAKPASIDWVPATATPLSALTAWQALFEHGSLDSNALWGGDEAAKKANGTKRVLITAAGGSVGGFAVQLAAAAGVSAVVGVCSGGKAERVRSLGATSIIDYTSTSVLQWREKHGGADEFDLIVDCVGGDTMVGLWAAVKDGGEFISVSDFPDRLRPQDGKKALTKSKFFIVQSLGVQLAEIARLLENKTLQPLVDSVYEFDQFQEAFDKLDTRTAGGKIVIQVNTST
ncbi:hypothetical protein VHEMI06815 [[Torrubiella] hemipterigena]|uniref:Enoyl reductase (ER) domain-containing protein n=1 Tax=[Torrubiella] hemipterigena TaxID=1531966 RepID=A0A0A1TLS8_9HYPO|nr:hypothetical protein VHEMI06815 [[Torrubiella] hemipterigena]